jgi:hypothetical protein
MSEESVKRVSIADPSPSEKTPLIQQKRNDEGDEDDDDDYDYFDGSEHYEHMKNVNSDRISSFRRESMAADRLSMRLLAIDDDDDEMEEQILMDTLNLDLDEAQLTPRRLSTAEMANLRKSTRKAGGKFSVMTGLCLVAFGLIIAALWIGAEFIGPPNQPVGPYELIERQVRSWVCHENRVGPLLQAVWMHHFLYL